MHHLGTNHQTQENFLTHHDTKNGLRRLNCEFPEQGHFAKEVAFVLLSPLRPMFDEVRVNLNSYNNEYRFEVIYRQPLSLAFPMTYLLPCVTSPFLDMHFSLLLVNARCVFTALKSVSCYIFCIFLPLSLDI